jgi:uncharacterized protein YqjF (DUF2071 family)
VRDVYRYGYRAALPKRGKLKAVSQISEFPPHPVRRPVMFQSWRYLTFLHWRYEPGEIRRLLPKRLELDTFDGAAWVGLTPFLLRGLRPPFAPALPWISHFPEMNVRTYVRGPDGEPGIWFFTLEADRLLAVTGARLTYRLPYRWADMYVRRGNDKVEYVSRRKWPFRSGAAHVSVQIGEPIEASEFDRFLTARFRLYTIVFGCLGFAQIEHEPWPLARASLLQLAQTVVERSGVPKPCGDPILLYSPGVDVRVGRVQLAR